MSSADFQNRLRKISEGPQSQLAESSDVSSDVQKSSSRLQLAIGGGFIGLGVHLLRKANENYEFFRDSGQAEQLFGLIAAGVVAFLVGTGLIIRAAKTRSDQTTARPSGTSAKKRFFSTMGLVVGFLLVFCIVYFLQMIGLSRSTGLEHNLAALEGLIVTTIAMLLMCLVWSIIGGIRTFFRFLGYTLLGFVLSLILLKLSIINPYHVVSYFGFTH